MVFARHRSDGVIQFHGRSLVGESVAQPYTCYEDNMMGTRNLLQVMQKTGVSRLEFSLAVAVSGNSNTSLIDEGHLTRPSDP